MTIVQTFTEFFKETLQPINMKIFIIMSASTQPSRGKFPTRRFCSKGDNPHTSDFMVSRALYLQNPLTEEEEQFLKGLIGTLTKSTLVKLSKDVCKQCPIPLVLPPPTRRQLRQEFGILQWFKDNFASVRDILTSSPPGPPSDFFPLDDDAASLLNSLPLTTPCHISPSPSPDQSEFSVLFGPDVFPDETENFFFNTLSQRADPHMDGCFEDKA
jgi:hypothetical protein